MITVGALASSFVLLGVRDNPRIVGLCRLSKELLIFLSSALDVQVKTPVVEP